VLRDAVSDERERMAGRAPDDEAVWRAAMARLEADGDL
jgi:hypothetical protein